MQPIPLITYGQPLLKVYCHVVTVCGVDICLIEEGVNN